jgi:hypothetical protein
MSLGPTSRKLVAAARGSLDPSAEIAARVKARVLAVSASPVAAKAAVTSKLVLLAAIASVVIGVVAIRHHASSSAQIAIAAPCETADEPGVPRRGSTAEWQCGVVDEPQIEPHFAAAMQSESAPTLVATPVAAATVHVRAQPIATVPLTLAREVQLLDAAMATTDPAARLETLAIYDRETSGNGQLAEDAAALTIEARCRTHATITEQFATFDQRWPHSVQRARIKAACF